MTTHTPADAAPPEAIPDTSPLVAHDSRESKDAQHGLEIVALHLTAEAGGRTILHDVSLRIHPGELVAIVGTTGAGKTTLLQALSGVRPASNGEVLFDGVPLYEHYNALRTYIGYVPQDDIIHRDLSVQTALGYAARLRMAGGYSNKQRKARVNEVLDELGLTEQRRTRVRNVSGGERKRVNLATELLTRPPVLFLDEPTSGLDPGTESKMMTLFRELADQGQTVMLVTHVARNISLCDKVLILAGSGGLAFFGTPDEALRYFGVEEFEEIYVLISEHRSPQEWEQLFRQTRYYEEQIGQPLARRMAEPPEQAADAAEQLLKQRRLTPAPTRGALYQFFLLSRRYARILLSDNRNVALLLLQAPIIGLLFWALIPRDVFSAPQGYTIVARQGNSVRVLQRDPDTGRLQNAPPGADLIPLSGPDCGKIVSGGGIPPNCSTVAGGGNNQALRAAQLAFFLAAVAVWLGTLNAIREIAKEDAIYRRERLVGLKVLPYIASKLTVLLFFMAVQALLLLSVTAAHVRFQMGTLHWQLPFQIQGQQYYLSLPTGAVNGVWLSLFLAGAASVAVALAISALVSNPDRALLAAPLVMVPQIMFAGGVAPIRDLGPAEPVSFIIATRWGYEAIGRVTNVVKEAAIPQQFPYEDQLSGPVGAHWLILGGFVLVFSAVAVGLQRLKDRR